MAVFSGQVHVFVCVRNRRSPASSRAHQVLPCCVAHSLAMQYALPFDVAFCALPSNAVSCRAEQAKLCFKLRCCAMLYNIYHAMLCCAMLRCAVPCPALVWFSCPALVSVLCYGCMLCYTVLAVFLVTQDMLLVGSTLTPHMHTNMPHRQVLCEHDTRMQKGRD